VNFSGNNAAATTQLTIATNAQTGSLVPLNRRESSTRLAGLLFLPGLLFAGIFAPRRRHLMSRFGGPLLLLLILSGLMAAGGCGGSSASSSPTGTYPVVVTANAVNGGATVTQKLTATVTITQ
jgi:hypothetical protein